MDDFELIDNVEETVEPQAEERPEYLLEGYESPEDQAKAYHELRSKYENLDHLITNGQWVNQVYQGNPEARDFIDRLVSGRPLRDPPQAPSQFEQYDPTDNAAAEKFWAKVYQNPMEYMTPRAELESLRQQNIQLATALQNLNGQINQRFNQMGLQDKVKDLHPTLQNMVVSGRMSLEEAKALSPKAISKQRDTQGRFATSRPKPGKNAAKKANNYPEAYANAQAQLEQGT